MSVVRLLACASSLLLFAGCAPNGPAQPPGSTSERPPAASGPKRIVAAITGDPPTLYNKLNTNNAVRGVDALEKFVVGGLANEDDQAALRPQLAAGPFKLKEWASGSHLVLEAFDGYALGRPKIDEIEVRFILDSNTLVANVLADTIDLTLGRGISIEQALQVRDQWRRGKVDPG